MRKTFKFIIVIFILLYLSACTVGPNYVQPAVSVPIKYKEAKNWKIAAPKDELSHGAWWTVFHDAKLNQLESQLDISNQNIAAAAAQYQQSLALVQEAAANYFPIVGASVSVTRQKQPVLLINPAATNFTGVPTAGQTNTDYFMQLSASWVPDLWGGVRRLVEQNSATAEATAAQLAGVELSMQATLAQDYFQLRALDWQQRLLDDTVVADKKALLLTQRGFTYGTASLSDVSQATATLKTVQAQAFDNGIARAQFEHAIAVLIGEPASDFSLKPNYYKLQPPPIPPGLPSELLERRPDIGQAERQVAAANAAIGVAIAAYFPNLTLSSLDGYESFSFQNWISKPSLFWSLGANVAETIIDGGLRIAQTAAARASYYQSVAVYRQTVLAAFQNVEDNLAATRILQKEQIVQQQAVLANQKALQLAFQDYQAGVTAYTTVIVAQTNTLTAQRSAIDIAGRRMVATVSLIEALGGCWN